MLVKDILRAFRLAEIEVVWNAQKGQYQAESGSVTACFAWLNDNNHVVDEVDMILYKDKDGAFSSEYSTSIEGALRRLVVADYLLFQNGFLKLFLRRELDEGGRPEYHVDWVNSPDDMAYYQRLTLSGLAREMAKDFISKDDLALMDYLKEIGFVPQDLPTWGVNYPKQPDCPGECYESQEYHQ